MLAVTPTEPFVPVSILGDPLSGMNGSLENAKPEVIELDEIQDAACRIAPYVKRTPTLIDTFLSGRFGTNLYLKHEELQRTSAFKVRGAFNKLLSLSSAERNGGVVAVSAGNHAQAVAYASSKLGLKSIILMPESTPSNYLRKTESYGAEVKLFPTITDAFAAASEYEAEGYVYVHPFEDVEVIAGQGTIGLEIAEDVPEVTDVVVSIGGGGLCGGVAAALKAVKPSVKVWGAETHGAESMAVSLAAGHVVELEKVTSIARTLGAPRVGDLNYALAERYLNGVTVVNDDEAVREMFCLLENAKVLTEPATACTLAAAERLKDNFGPDSHVVLILCGGNIGLEELFGLVTNGR
ncbi:MAG: threonine/serine dehydratase [Acidobacteria bacterium]|nr:threonine/serine dehydratase [Acidobacteriota bacterium]